MGDEVMSFSLGLNASAATYTKNRTPGSVCPSSGLCATCVEGCIGLCEVGKSALRGREVIYPQPFGTMTAAATKDYPIDMGHFSIMGTAVGAHGIEADSDKAIFPAVSVQSAVGADGSIRLLAPFAIPGLGSTRVAKDNWDGLAVGAAISGIILTVGENVCAMDPDSTIENGKVKCSPDLEYRVNTFKKWYNGYGAIVVQSNVEDTNLGVLEYAIESLGVDIVELKWGQGAKDIGGEVKLPSLERALQLKARGYIVLPDPENADVQAAFKAGVFKEFERHSRIGMVSYEGFMARVKELRERGAKYVFLKTGAYRPADLARAVKFASDAKIDMLTVDGAGGGTGMSPWRMMNEWGIPTIWIEALMHQYLDRLASKGCYVPPAVITGGFSLEDHVFKAIALGAPYVKAVGLARAPITAAMVGKTVGKMVSEGKLPSELAKYGETVEQLFTASVKLKEIYGAKFEEIPTAAVGLYNYIDRLNLGLQQLMCGARKFNLNYITRNDIVALSREAADITGIEYVMDADKAEVDSILGC